MEPGWCVWLTGLPGCGKSTIARELKKKLKESGVYTQIVSSDALRKVMTPDPKYTQKERELVYRALAFVAKLLTDNKINVIIDATGNRRQFRKLAKKEICKFVEIYLRCPIEVCIDRESNREEKMAPKDIYKKGLEGESDTVPGLGVPYEEPISPDLEIDSKNTKPDKCAVLIFQFLREKFKNSFRNSTIVI